MRPVDHVLRVFTDADGRFGNFLGIFLDTGDWTDSVRVDPGWPPRPDRMPVLSANLLQMVMVLAPK